MIEVLEMLERTPLTSTIKYLDDGVEKVIPVDNEGWAMFEMVTYTKGRTSKEVVEDYITFILGKDKDVVQS